MLYREITQNMKLLTLLFFITIVDGKECPTNVPIPIGEAFSVLCNTTLNPTGMDVNDPPCYYDNCSNQRSSVCGCVDFSLFDESGMFWGCIHSKCECTNDKEGDECDIHGEDFQDPKFLGNAPVAGNGCTLKDRTGCLCEPVLDNEIQIEEWTWACSGDTSYVSGSSQILTGGWVRVIFIFMLFNF